MLIRRFQSEILRFKTSQKFYVMLHLWLSAAPSWPPGGTVAALPPVTAAVWIQQCMVLVVWDNVHHNVIRCCSMCEVCGNNNFHSLVQPFDVKKKKKIILTSLWAIGQAGPLYIISLQFFHSFFTLSVCRITSSIQDDIKTICVCKKKKKKEIKKLHISSNNGMSISDCGWLAACCQMKSPTDNYAFKRLWHVYKIRKHLDLIYAYIIEWIATSKWLKTF